jgi:hypothetical protein
MALFSECSLECASKLLDTADIVREAIFHQIDYGVQFPDCRQLTNNRQVIRPDIEPETLMRVSNDG